MKNFLIFLFFLAMNSSIIAQHDCGLEEPANPPTNSGQRPAPFCGDSPSNLIDYGNFMYIPDKNSELLTIRMNLHIMQKSANDPQNYTSADIPFLTNLVNTRLNNLLAEEGLAETCEFSVSGNPVSLDAKIRVEVNKILFYVDPIAHVNGEGFQSYDVNGNLMFNGNGNPIIETRALTSWYCKANYLDNTSEFDNELNVFFIESPDGSSDDGYKGWGPGYSSELANHIILQDAFSEKGTEWWTIDGLFLHEIGHCLGLLHSWTSSQENLFEYECNTSAGWNKNNHIMSYNPAQSYNSPLQDAHMRRVLLTTWRKKQLTQTPSNNDTYVFDFDYEITSDQTINWVGNILVKSGHTLTVKGLLQMHAGRKITVERGARVLIDGGIISSCDEWQGIIVEGDAEHFSQANAGLVEMFNDATIENAVNAISMKPVHIPWPQTPNYYGGLVTAMDAHFINCRRAVQFMKYGTGIVKDKSTFTNCTFDGMKYAITIWANNGVRIDNCHFNNISQYAVHPYNSEVFIENGCLFENMPMGVNIINTFPQPFAPHIGDRYNNPNDFNCSEYGVHATSTGSTDPLDIVNNNFLGGEVGIHVTGDSYFEIHHNDLLGYTGSSPEEISAVTAVSTGYNDNKIFENNISSSLFGSRAIWENPGLRYLFNCFGFNADADILVEAGSIHPFQEGSYYDNDGSDSTEVGNCFTKGGVIEIDNTGNAPISYFVDPATQPLDCEYLDNSLNVVQADGDPANLTAACGSVGSQGNVNVGDFCGGPFKTKQEILDRIASVKAYIQQIENTNYPSQAYKDYLLEKYNRCLDRLLAQTGVIILDPDPTPTNDPHGLLRMEEFITFYDGTGEFDYQIMAFGMMIQLNDINRARTYLNGLVANTTEKQDFVRAQNINLNYLDNPSSYVLSSSDETILYGIATKSNPLAGYARSIYEAITENKVDLDLPDRAPRGGKRSSEQADELEPQSQITISPNPAFDYVIVSSAGEEIRSVSVVDMGGSTMAKNVRGNTDYVRVDISSLPKGVYIVLVENTLGEIVSEKLVKL